MCVGDIPPRPLRFFTQQSCISLPLITSLEVKFPSGLFSVIGNFRHFFSAITFLKNILKNMRLFPICPLEGAINLHWPSPPHHYVKLLYLPTFKQPPSKPGLSVLHDIEPCSERSPVRRKGDINQLYNYYFFKKINVTKTACIIKQQHDAIIYFNLYECIFTD